MYKPINVWSRLGICIEQGLQQLSYLWWARAAARPWHLCFSGSTQVVYSLLTHIANHTARQHHHTCALIMASAKLPPRSLSAFSNGDSPYIMKYNVHPSDQMSIFSLMVHWEGTSNSSGARYAAVH